MEGPWPQITFMVQILMEDLGQFLRQQREKEHLSLEEMALRTRIRLPYVQAMEENRFDQLPHQVSARGFLKCYASAIGLDGEEVLKRFMALQPLREASSDKVFTEEKPAPAYLHVKRAGSLPFSFWVTLWVIGILLLLGVGFRMLRAGRTLNWPTLPMPFSSHSVNDPAEIGPVVRPAPAVVATEAAPAAVATEAAPQRTDEPAVASTETAPAVIPVPPTPSADAETVRTLDALTLDIEAVEPSWVRVVIDETQRHDVLLKAREKMTWRARGEFLLTVGNAGGVRVYLNGQDVGSIGPSGRVVRNIRLP